MRRIETNSIKAVSILVDSKSQTTLGSESHHRDAKQGEKNPKQWPILQNHNSVVSTSLDQNRKDTKRNDSKLGSHLILRIHHLKNKHQENEDLHFSLPWAAGPEYIVMEEKKIPSGSLQMDNSRTKARASSWSMQRYQQSEQLAENNLMLYSQILFAFCHYESTSGYTPLTPTKQPLWLNGNVFLRVPILFCSQTGTCYSRAVIMLPPWNYAKYLLQTSTYTEKMPVLGLESFVSIPQRAQPTFWDQEHSAVLPYRSEGAIYLQIKGLR